MSSNQDIVNQCMNSYSNFRYWCPQPGQEDAKTIEQNCRKFCKGDKPNGCQDDQVGDATECVTYCNNAATICKPAPSLQSAIYRASSSDSKKMHIENKDILVLSLIILAAYLFTTSRFVYAITNKILPTFVDNQPTLLGYSLHTLLFLLVVVLALKYYKIECKNV